MRHLLGVILTAGFALAQTPDFMADGMKALDAKNYAAALDLFTKAVAADPKDYAAHFHVALSYSLLDKYAEAVPEYRATLELKPRLYDADLNLGMCLLHLRDAAAAEPVLKEAVEQKPKEFRAVYYLGQALLSEKKYAEAESVLMSAIELNPGSAGAEAGVAQAISQLAGTDAARLAIAEQHFRKAASMDAGYKPALLNLAQVYEAAKLTPQAVAIYREFPENAGAQERMGALLAQSGAAADAIPALESAVAKSPTSANRVALAQAYVKNNQGAKAIPLVEQAVAAEPNDFELQMFLGKLLRDQRKFNEASQHFVAASKLQPGAVQPWNELASVMIVVEQYPQALTALDHVHELGGETPPHYYFRAISYDHLHQLKEALANYNKFLELSQGKSPDEEFKSRQRARIIQAELNKR